MSYGTADASAALGRYSEAKRAPRRAPAAHALRVPIVRKSCLSAGSSLKNARRLNRRSMTGFVLYRQARSRSITDRIERHAAGMGSRRTCDNNYPKGTNDVKSH